MTKPPPASRPRRAKKKSKKRHSRPTCPKPAGRPHGCTQAVVDNIIRALSVGATMSDAATFAGKSERAYHYWQARGLDAVVAAGHDPAELPDDLHEHESIPKAERIFVQLMQRSLRALSQLKVTLLASMIKAARGGTLRNDDGEVVNHVAGDWRAAAKLLAIRDPGSYAERHRHELSGPQGEAVGIRIYLPEERDEP